MELNSYDQVLLICRLIQGLLSIIGIFGNVLTICVFSRKSLRKYSYSFYSRALALSDTVLLAFFLINLAKDFGLIESKSRLSFFCSIRAYHGYVNGTFSLWLLSIISFDRLIKIVYPNRFKLFKRRWFQLLLILLTIVYSFLVNLKVPFNYRYEEIRMENRSETICYLPFKPQNEQSWIALVNFLLVNLVINNIINVKIICCIINSRRKSNNITQYSFSSDRKFGICSIGLNIVSLITRAPIAVGVLVANYLKFNRSEVYLTLTISLTIVTFDHSLTLFINILLNSLFYKEFLIMIGIRKTNRLLRL